jgi:enoyl-CoA hydratase
MAGLIVVTVLRIGVVLPALDPEGAAVPPIDVTRDGPVTVVTLDCPETRNAVDGVTARALADAFRAFDADEQAEVAVLTGAGGTFCSGADLRDVAGLRLDPEGDAPLGVSRLLLSKPVIAAVEGYAVAGGLELALWCDLRVAAEDATFGVFCRRWGVPLVDGGTVRLPRLIGHGRALDLILTGRAVGAEEALRIGLADRVVPSGRALDAAVQLARQLAAFPQRCLRADRLSVHRQWSLDVPAALRGEYAGGAAVVASGETAAGAERFASGAGRHGTFNPAP